MIDIQKMITKKYPKIKDNKVIKGAISKFADSIVHQKEINNFLKENSHLGSFEFIDEALKYFNFNYLASDTDAENIPASGRVVIIANHPLGSLDAFALIKLVSKVRKDVKIVASEALSSVDALAPIFLDVNNFQARQSKDAIKRVYEALNAEQAVIVFPSGEVSRATPTGIKDKIWHRGFLKFAQRSGSPILPVFLGGKNSKTFYSVSAINKKLSTLLLSNEMFGQRGNSIEILVGEIIPNENINPKGLLQDKVIDLHKKHVYSLKKKKSFFLTQTAIAHPENRQELKKELKKCKLLGTTKDDKRIYLYDGEDKNSIVVNEIGRLRELSFRKVGEGVNKKRDIDKYDRYYKHIVLWDNEDLEIVGAYRIGETKNIVEKFGKEALYASTLFDFNENFDKYLNDSIELGRSFVQPKYWGSRALDYLWQGIGAYLRNNPEVKYLFGPVSMSATYSKVAKDMILHFYDMNFHDEEKLVNAKIPYNFNSDERLINNLDSELNSDDYKENFRTLKKALAAINANVPTLYKQYADLCEEGGIKFCAYNVDPDFSNCVDSFILVEIDKMKEAQKKRYIQL
jgi:putative hemolysin